MWLRKYYTCRPYKPLIFNKKIRPRRFFSRAAFAVRLVSRSERQVVILCRGCRCVRERRRGYAGRVRLLLRCGRNGLLRLCLCLCLDGRRLCPRKRFLYSPSADVRVPSAVVFAALQLETDVEPRAYLHCRRVLYRAIAPNRHAYLLRVLPLRFEDVSLPLPHSVLAVARNGLFHFDEFRIEVHNRKCLIVSMSFCLCIWICV